VTTGEIVDRAESYLGKIECLLISARVKGGNSGGPVVSKRGEVVGLVFGTPSTYSDAIDKLGFGIAFPSDEICRFLSEVDSGSDEVQDVNPVWMV
jgi:serine protease Do